MKNNKKTYYSLFQSGKSAVLNIFGDITSFPWFEGDISNIMLSKKLEELEDVDVIDVYINSYGGEVAEGLAIYNALKRHKAKIRTHVDGFACSIASVIFMAGDERIMPSTSCLMIHNPWTYVAGNANELRKQADDLDTIGECSINAYMDCVNITIEELKELLDQEKWLSPSESLEKGFATSLEKEDDEEHASQSVKSKVISMLLDSNEDDENNPDEEPENGDDTDEDTENTDTSTDEETDSNDDNETDNTDEEVEEENVDTADGTDEDEEENENDEDDGNPSQKATDMVAVFLNNLEREMLK